MPNCDVADTNFPFFSALRRRLLGAVTCGACTNKPKPSKQPLPPLPKQVPEKLSEFLEAAGSESGSDDARKVEAAEEMRYIVRKLQFAGNDELRRESAEDVRRMAKDDGEARETMAVLGAVAPLVSMIDSGDPELQISALYALLNLGIGNDSNKAAIVEAGAVHKMLKLMESGSSKPVTEAIVANFLSLTALDSNKPIVGASGAIPLFTRHLSDPNCSCRSKHDTLRALFNLSISPSNLPHIIDSGVVPAMLSSIGDMEVTERILSVLSNLVSSPEGRRAVSKTPDAFPTLIDVLNWADSPSCQEKAGYILMVMAHKGCHDRTVMIESGIVSVLLELTLIGTALAQKRASRILECLMVDKGKRVSEGFESSLTTVSAPIWGAGMGWEVAEEAGEEREAVKKLVQQSLQRNMRRIAKRANLPPDFLPSDQFRSLTLSETSKSLPF